MLTLTIFNLITIALLAVGIWLSKRFVKSDNGRYILLLLASVFTVLLHYSSLIYHLITGGDAIGYLKDTPNLILPIYPCNVVMWCAVIFGLMKNKGSKFGVFLADYLFWFGIISTLVGMFANVDFIMNPTLLNYKNLKSILAHATLLFNVLLLPTFGYVKVNLWKNMGNILISILLMLVIGAYCNLLFEILGSWETAYDINSMFLIHSPFDGIDFLTYPVIVLIAIPIYFIVFAICEVFAYKRGERFYNKTRLPFVKRKSEK